MEISTGYSFAPQIISRGKPQLTHQLAANSAITVFLPLEAENIPEGFAAIALEPFEGAAFSKALSC